MRWRRQAPALWQYVAAATVLLLGAVAMVLQLAFLNGRSELGVSLRCGADLHVEESLLPWLRNVSGHLEQQHAYGLSMRSQWRVMIASRIAKTLPDRWPTSGSREARAAALTLQLTTSSPAQVEQALSSWLRQIRPRSTRDVALRDIRLLLRLRASDLEQRLLAQPTPSLALVNAVGAATSAVTGEMPQALGLAVSLRSLLADMFCSNCAEKNAHAQRRAVTGAVVTRPAEHFAALLHDFTGWVIVAWADALHAMAVTLTPDTESEEPDRPSSFTVFSISHNVSLGRLATGNSASTLLDEKGNEYVLAQERETTMQGDASLVSDIVVVVCSTVAGGMAAARLGQPLLLGYLISGMAAGPHGASLINEVIQTEALAQLGVALILFTLGVELDLTRIAHVRHVALIGGFLQQVVTTAACALLGAIAFELPLVSSIFIGLCVCMASTAVVLRCLQARSSVSSSEGTLMLGVLVTQDLSVGLVLGALPVFRSAANLSRAVLHTATAAAATAAALLLLRLSLPHFVGAVRASNAHELNVLFPLGVCLAAGTFTDNLGISIELGSFAAGLVWTQALPDTASHAVELLEPIRHTFGALFFFAIGMVISPSFLLSHLRELLLLALLALTLKLAVAAPLVHVFGYSWGVSFRCAAGLAHMGEFGFLIASRGRSLGLLEQDAYLLLVGTTAVSLLTSPIVLGLVLPPSLNDAADGTSSSRQAERTPLTDAEGAQDRGSIDSLPEDDALSCSPVTTPLVSMESLTSLRVPSPIA